MPYKATSASNEQHYGSFKTLRLKLFVQEEMHSPSILSMWNVTMSITPASHAVSCCTESFPNVFKLAVQPSSKISRTSKFRLCTSIISLNLYANRNGSFRKVNGCRLQIACKRNFISYTDNECLPPYFYEDIAKDIRTFKFPKIQSFPSLTY